jgi:hypothetical protein
MGVLGHIESKVSARRRRSRSSKAARVDVVCVDELVTCPSCGNPMHLTELRTFNCNQCSREITAEEALTAIETANA